MASDPPSVIMPMVTAVPLAAFGVPNADSSALDEADDEDEPPLPALDVLLLSLLHAVATRATRPRPRANRAPRRR
jgi:hypothetical protein